MKKEKNKAVAISYNKGYPAPVVVAKGEGHNAERILRIAEKEGILIKKDNNLAETLYLADLYSLIPEEQYEIIAEILSFVNKFR
jgi:flagellar biosynthesis protein